MTALLVFWLPTAEPDRVPSVCACPESALANDTTVVTYVAELLVTDLSHAAVADEEDAGGLGLGAGGGGCSVAGCSGGLEVDANTDLELLELRWEWRVRLERGRVSPSVAARFGGASPSGNGA